MSAPSPAGVPRSEPPQLQRAHARAVAHLVRLQQPNGAWAGEVVWNPMLVCQWVIVRHVTGRPVEEPRRTRVHRSLEVQVRPDGGFGMHCDGEAWLFHTTLAYVALRLLGYGPDDPLVAGAQAWLRRHGGVVELPQWGRVWLAVLGLYPWTGVRPILPELWLLPDRSPAHPRRLYCHMRLIYLGLASLYGLRFTAPLDGLVQTIRSELYPEGYDVADFEHHAEDVAATDLFERPGLALRGAFRLLRGVERGSRGLLRRPALERCLEAIEFELHSTGYVCLSPVNGQLFCLALYATDPAHPELDRALRGVEYWMWEDDEEGLRICGARSDIWDTSFVLQTLAEAPVDDAARRAGSRAASWLAAAQLEEDIPDGARHHRAPARGGWGFADEHHPWPVSDCTAEALEGLVRFGAGGGPVPPAERRRAAVEFVLARQNDDGGFGSYECRRGSMLLRHFNPSEIYGNCMLEYSYTECTASCIKGLALALANDGEVLGAKLRAAARASIERGRRFLIAAQHASGGWAGFWGINFTYGTFFAVHGLLAAGTPAGEPAIARAVEFLLGTQRPDGGWGEAWEGMLDGRPVGLPDGAPSLVTQTAWAALTLMAAAPERTEPAIARALDLLLARQQPDGGWPHDRATGVFFNTAVLDYRLYKHTFPTWALARRLALAL